MKLRMKFKKEGLTRFISHLDMMRTFERAFRRANLPIAFTHGFNPRPKMTFTPALSLGVTSSSEYMDVEFFENVSKEDVIFKLNSALPKGIQITDVEDADGKLALSMLNGAKYVVTVILGEVGPEELRKSIKTLLQQKEITVEKNTKSGKKLVDIVPFIFSVDLVNHSGNMANIVMLISIGQQGSVSPITIIRELERTLQKKLEVTSIHREEIFYISEDKKISPFDAVENISPMEVK